MWSRRSRRLNVVHRFIGGIRCFCQHQSVKRTTEHEVATSPGCISRPFHGLHRGVDALPSTEVLGYFL